MNKYKIALVLNRTNEVPNLKKYLDWFKLNTPIEIEWIDTIHTDFDVTTYPLGNIKKVNGVNVSGFEGVVCGPDIAEKLRTVIPENKYNAVVLYVGNKLDGIRVSTVNIGQVPLYPDTEIIQLRRIDDSGKDLNHEMFHGFFVKARKCQIDIVDPMDTYLNDSDLTIDSVVNTNREQALQLLRPYWDKICAFRSLSTNPSPIVNLPIITLTRTKYTSKETLGELRSNDGKFGCDTLELPWRINVKNISCIPTGDYTCKWNRTLKFPLGGYEVQNVPNRTGIRIHKGNYFFNVEGCILLGSLPKDINGDGEIDLQNSTLIVNAFEKFMGKKDFKLIIK